MTDLEFFGLGCQIFVVYSLKKKKIFVEYILNSFKILAKLSRGV